MTRRTALLVARLVAAAALAAVLLAGCAVGPNYSRPQMPAPPHHRFVEGTAAGGVPRRRALVGGHRRTPCSRRSSARRSPATSTCATATARVAEARAQCGIAKSFLFPRGRTSPAGTRRAAGLAALRAAAGDGAGDKTFQNCNAGLQPLLGDRPLRPDPAREGGGVRPVPRHRAGPARRPHHARGRRGLHLLPAPRARPGARDRPSAPSTLNDETVGFYDEAAARAASRTGSRSTRPGEPRPHGRRDPRHRAADRARRERAQRAARPPAGADRARRTRSPSSTSRRRSPPGIPAALLERRPDVARRPSSFLVAANADVGAAKALFFPTISPDRPPRHASAATSRTC